MASNTLSGAGVTPANTKAQLLHIGTGTLGAGAVVRLGDGTATPLTISSAGISNRLRSSTTKSASRPGASTPFGDSSNDADAASAV